MGVRRENKITTSPSASLANRRTSLKNLISGGGSNKVSPAGGGGLQAIGESQAQTGKADVDRKPVRSASMAAPRRLSYIGALSNQEEKHLANLYDRNRALSACLREHQFRSNSSRCWWCWRRGQF